MMVRVIQHVKCTTAAACWRCALMRLAVGRSRRLSHFGSAHGARLQECPPEGRGMVLGGSRVGEWSGWVEVGVAGGGARTARTRLSALRDPA